MIHQSFWLGFLPFLDAIGGLVANLRSSVTLHGTSYGGQFIDGLGNGETEVKSIFVVDDSGPLSWQLWTIDLLDTDLVGAVLVLPCVRSMPATFTPPPVLTAPTSWQPRRKQRKAVSGRRPARISRDGPFRRLVAGNEQYLTYAAVVAMLQLFLHLTRANATTLFLPMLSRATGCGRRAARIGDAVLVLVNAAGVLGSARATRQLGREAMCAISGVLIVFCQIAVPAIMGAHAGLSGGTRMTAGHAAWMFALACAVSGGFSWAWGALFWTVPGEGIRSVGQAAGAALGFGLGFAQMQCFLLTLRQLKHAAFAHYAVWIWS